MGLVRKIALRFVLDRSSSPSGSTKVLSRESFSKGFVSFISLISITGLALGVTALLVVTSVMNGFERELKTALTAFHGHILLFSRGEPIAKPEQYTEDLSKNFPAIAAVSPYIFAEAMLSSSKAVAGAIVEGTHRPTLDGVSRISEKLKEGRLPEARKGDVDFDEVTLGSEVARKLQVKVGDSVLLTIPFGKSSEEPLVQKLKVVGLIHLGMYEYDSKYGLIELSDLQRILNMKNQVNAFKILTKDALTSTVTTAELNDKFAYPMRARDWSTLNRNLFYAIRLEKAVISIILLAIVLVASFNIISTIMMLVHDKKAQIAILKALGWGSRQTFSVFMLIGFVMAFLGMFLGLGFGRALCGLVQWKSLIDLPGDIYMLSRIPVEIRVWEWGVICVLSVLLAVLATLWPSYKVAKENPVEGLKYE